MTIRSWTWSGCPGDDAAMRHDSGAIRRSFGRRLALSATISLALVLAVGPSSPGVAGAGLPAWTGGVDLYRPGAFSTQATWYWCTAADVQIARNIVFALGDHSSTGQRRYFEWMRAHNHYTIPVSDGVDPAGWAQGLAHFVDARYRVVTSSSFANALRSAVRRLRQTNRPVALLVDHGNHGWLLTGFTASADPAVTAAFTVTGVRVVGPLYGRQSRNGYDMPPNTLLTPARLAAFLSPWHYARTRMMWEGRWVTIQAVPST